MKILRWSLAILLILGMGPAEAARKPAAAAGGSGLVCEFSASMADKPGDEPPRRFAVSTYAEKLAYKGLEVEVKRGPSGYGLGVSVKYPDGTRASIESSGKLHLMQFVALGEGTAQISYELDCR
ncbi:MAG: hypothetical protein AB7K68_12645 [Bacteriovoracia bacterium]